MAVEDVDVGRWIWGIHLWWDMDAGRHGYGVHGCVGTWLCHGDPGSHPQGGNWGSQASCAGRGVSCRHWKLDVAPKSYTADISVESGPVLPPVLHCHRMGNNTGPRALWESWLHPALVNIARQARCQMSSPAHLSVTPG